VTFRIDYVVEAIGNKEFGSVFLASPTGPSLNIATDIVKNGWAKVCVHVAWDPECTV